MQSTTTVDGNDLVTTRHIAASPERIWRALTDAAELKEWFVPKPWRITEAVVEAYPGGRFLTAMVGPNGENEDCGASEGCVLAVEPNRMITWTDALAGGYRPNDKPFMTAIITLEPTDSGTRYTARVLHKDAADRDRHSEMGFAEGWGTCLEQLAERVEAR